MEQDDENINASITADEQKDITPKEQLANTASDAELLEREELNSFISELQAKVSSKAQLRAENENCVRPGDSHFTQLDSSLKRNTAFVKRLKQFTSAQLEALLKDMSGLNLSKYTSEMCSALTEAKLKMNDIPEVVTLCSRLHQTYADFSGHFLVAWQRTLLLKPGEKISNPCKLRVDLRLFAELVSSGIISVKHGLQLLGSVLINLISQDYEDQSNFSVILSFCRHCGEEYAGLVPRKIKNLAKKYDVGTMPKSDLLEPGKQRNMRGLLKNYFKNLCKHLFSEQAKLLYMTRNVRRIMELKGKMSNKKKEKCELMQANFDKLLSSIQKLSDLIDEPMPELPKEAESCNPTSVIDNMLEDVGLRELDRWGDEETKSFYTDLPDLRHYLPDFSSPKAYREQIEEPGELSEESLDGDIEMDIDDSSPNTSDPFSDNDDGKDGSSDELSSSELDSNEPECNQSAQNMNIYSFNELLSNLNNCVNRELIDSAAIEFLQNFNTKNNRKKLIRSLFAVKRTRLDLLPFLSRFVAIINLSHTDVAIDLSKMLRRELKWNIRKKNQLNIESKIKLARFIGELVKFGLFKKLEALNCLKLLLQNFQHHQIEMACALIEVAGVYLYNCRDTRLLTNVLLDQMLRLKTAKALDTRHVAQIESVYYLVKPPETVKQDNGRRFPVRHEYIRHLIFEELCKENVYLCIHMMRCINWNNTVERKYAVKCMSKAYLLRFPVIRGLADLVGGLSAYQDHVVTMVIENVFEDIRAALEIHSPKLAQRRIAMAKFLGELYNYKMVRSADILNTLYSIISHGISTANGVVSELDPPHSLFRLKLACMLLDTCGPYFASNRSRINLDYFLVFFQHYYWNKISHIELINGQSSLGLLPKLASHVYQECLLHVRPKLKLFESLEEATEAIQQLREELYPTVTDSEEPVEGGINNFGSIPECNELKEILSSAEKSFPYNITKNKLFPQSPGSSSSEPCGNQTDYDFGANGASSSGNFDNTFENASEQAREQLEFDEMFEKITTESYQEHLKEPHKPNTAKDIHVPLTTCTTKKSCCSKNKDEQESDDVPFVLITRGGKGKQMFKKFVAPSDSQLVKNFKLQEEKSRKEKETVKQITLEITERLEEQNYNGGKPVKIIGTSKPEFRHQKGAPDADSIFK